MTIDDVANSLPNGFHDAEILNIHLDFANEKASFLMNIDLCDPDTEVEITSREGYLHLSGLLYCVLEPPGRSFKNDYRPSDKLWVTDDSSDFSELKTCPKLPEPLPDQSFKYWFFDGNHNNFIYLAAMDASFEWKDKE